MAWATCAAAGCAVVTRHEICRLHRREARRLAAQAVDSDPGLRRAIDLAIELMSRPGS
jgi:hypothetical protein